MFRKGWGVDDALAPSEMPVDPTLPQLSKMLDPCEMERILRHALPGLYTGGPHDIERCRIVNVRYRPGLKCLVSYRLDVRDRNDTQGEARFLTVCAVSEDRAERRLPRIMQAARHNGVRFGYLPDHRMVVTCFPHDLRIPQLHKVAIRDALQRALRISPQSHKARAQGLADSLLTATVISYRPERSCLIRCDVPESSATPSYIFARVYLDDRGERVFDAMRALWEDETRRVGLISVAEPLGYDPETRTLFHGAVEGTSPRDIASTDFIEHLSSIAQSLAAIHRSSVAISQTRKANDELGWLARMARGLDAVRPAAGDRLNALLLRLGRRTPDPPDASRGVVHGDFSMNQILIYGPRVSVIDFDDVGVGDTYADLGTFLARLTARIPNETTARSAADVFRRHYEESQGAPLQHDRLQWYQALAYVRLGLSALSQLKPGWPRRLHTQLNSAENLLQRDVQ